MHQGSQSTLTAGLPGPTNPWRPPKRLSAAVPTNRARDEAVYTHTYIQTNKHTYINTCIHTSMHTYVYAYVLYVWLTGFLMIFCDFFVKNYHTNILGRCKPPPPWGCLLHEVKKNILRCDVRRAD